MGKVLRWLLGFGPGQGALLALVALAVFAREAANLPLLPELTPDSAKYIDFSPVIPHGYSLLLAAWRLLSPDLAGLPLLQLALYGAGILVLAVALGRRLDSLPAALALVLLVGLYLPQLEARRVMTDPAYAAALAAAAGCLILYAAARRRRWLIAAAGALAAGFIVRPIAYAVLVPFLLVAALVPPVDGRRLAPRLALCALPFILAYALAAGSNAIHNGAFRIGNWGGMSLLGKGLVLARPIGTASPIGDVDWAAPWGAEARAVLARIENPALLASTQRFFMEYLRWFAFLPALEDLPAWRDATEAERGVIVARLAEAFIRQDRAGFLGLAAAQYLSLALVSRILTEEEARRQHAELKALGELPHVDAFFRTRKEGAYEYYWLVPGPRPVALVLLTRGLAATFLAVSLLVPLAWLLTGARRTTLAAEADLLFLILAIHATYVVTALMEGAHERYLVPTWAPLIAADLLGIRYLGAVLRRPIPSPPGQGLTTSPPRASFGEAYNNREDQAVPRLARVLFGALAALVLAGAAEAQSNKVRIATEGAYEPFNFKAPNGELQGFDVDIAKALCERAKLDCEIIAQDWDGIIPGLLAKKYDAIVASMSITEERKKSVAFTNKYYDTPARFVAKKGANLQFTKEGLKGKSVGVQRATTHADHLEKNWKDVVNIKQYDTQENVNLDLAAGRLDAVLADSIVMLEGFLKKPEGKDFEFVGPEQRFGEGAGIAVRKEDNELREKLNKAIADIRADGTYAKINNKYFPFDIY